MKPEIDKMLSEAAIPKIPKKIKSLKEAMKCRTICEIARVVLIA